MIQIPNDAFRWDILNDIYGEKRPLVRDLQAKILNAMAQKPPVAVNRLFSLWFYEDGALSARKISAFLTCRRPRDRILEYEAARPNPAAVNTVFSTVFDYNAFSHVYRDRVLEAMGVSVCPYCNRQYITTYPHNGVGKATADIDHFYSKSRYPFLALSLYNFVPSCAICNSRLKRAADFRKQPHVNPHERGFGGDARFRLRNPLCIADSRISPECELENRAGDPEIDQSIRTFRLNAIYEKSHSDYVRELIDKAHIYEDTLLEEYLSGFDGLFPGGAAQMKRLLYGNYLSPRDAHKRPLAKLTQDLLSQLGVIDDPYG